MYIYPHLIHKSFVKLILKIIFIIIKQAWAIADLEEIANKVKRGDNLNSRPKIMWLDTTFGGITRLLWSATYHPTCYFREHGTNQILNCDAVSLYVLYFYFNISIGDCCHLLCNIMFMSTKFINYETHICFICLIINVCGLNFYIICMLCPYSLQHCILIIL